MEKTVDVVIPVYKPDSKFKKLISRLEAQTYPVHKIILMNTQEEYWNPEYIAGLENVEVHHITKKEFDHGKTRRQGAELSNSDYLLFMTQDAIPYDHKMLEYMVADIQREQVGAVYARQLPAKDCKVLERYTRSFNYPDHSSVKSLEDLPRLGIKTYFCSNVCALYDKATYDKLGGFVSRAIFNEDMIYAHKLISNGYKIAYCAQAQVVHSHNYNCMQQFHRNFDLGVSQAEHPEIFENLPAEGEGIRLVKNTAKYALSIKKPWLLFTLFFQSAAKYAGFFLGKRYKKLPKKLILWCTMNREYWTFSS